MAVCARCPRTRAWTRLPKLLYQMTGWCLVPTGNATRSPMLLLRIGLAAGLTAAVLGCSSSVAPGRVRGTISYKGQLVKAGTVYFMYEHGGQYRAEIKPDGSYQFTDLPVGEAKVVIDTEPFNPDQKVQVYNQQSQQYAKGMAKSISEYNA